MSTAYDPKVFAENYRNTDQSAKMMVALFPVAGTLLGFALGANVVCCGLFKAVTTLAGGAAGGYAGHRYGLVRAAETRTQAQTAMCLAEIERNTRQA
jgi:putative effector of murein hydrolase